MATEKGTGSLLEALRALPAFSDADKHVREDLHVSSKRGRKYFLKMTCVACPEQYDVYLDGEKVSYFRLRHGEFRAECPDVGGKLVYSASTLGDGVFNDEEKLLQLTAAVEKVDDWSVQNLNNHR